MAKTKIGVFRITEEQGLVNIKPNILAKGFTFDRKDLTGIMKDYMHVTFIGNGVVLAKIATLNVSNTDLMKLKEYFGV